LSTLSFLLKSPSSPAARLYRRLADVASAVWLVLTTVPAETARAVAVTGAGTGDLLWDSPVGQLARAAQRSWAELTVDLPKVLPRPWQFVDNPGLVDTRHEHACCRIHPGERGACITRACRCVTAL